MKKSNVLLIGATVMVLAGEAFGASGISDKLNEVVNVNKDVLDVAQKTSVSWLDVILAWIPLVAFIVGGVGMGVYKYDELKQERKGLWLALVWALGGAIAGVVIGYALVYLIGLPTKGGAEALDGVTRYWSGS